MIIYYSPEYSGFTYTGLKDKGGILFDTAVVDTGGLINLLCLHGGMHYEVSDSTERMIAYYKAMRKYLHENPKNVLAKSFKTDGLNTAKVCLSWRDTLVLAGWSKNAKQPSDRMTALQGIEEFFNSPGTVDILPNIIKGIEDGCTLPDNLEIITPCDYKLLHPAIVRLMNALKDRGTKFSVLEHAIKKGECDLNKVASLLNSNDSKNIKLSKDNSLQILNFEEKDDALRYLTLQKDNAYDVWIDSDSKQLDNWLRLEGKPTTGSTVAQCMPQISQLFIIGLGLFSKPLNVNTLLEWLYAPMTPVGRKFAWNLANTIVYKGGYFNKECQEVIDKYLNGEYDWFEERTTDEQKKEIINKKRKSREYAVSTFLPRIKGHKEFTIDSTDNNVDVDRLREFTEALNAWSKQQMSMTDDADRKAQLGKISSETDAVSLLLEDYEGSTIPFSTIENWMGSLYKYADYRQYRAQRNCRNVISSPGNMAGKSKNTIWCDFQGGDAGKLTYSFLEPIEKKEFKKTLNLWEDAKEQKYHRSMLLMPFNMTSDQLTLVTYNRNGSEEVEKHPLMIQLEQQVKNLDDIVLHPHIDESLYEEADIIDNKNRNDDADEFIHLPHPEYIKFPKYESYTSLSTMYQSPLDYTFGSIAHIQQVGASAMAEIWTTKGNVAHAVIQTLFWNEKDKASGYPDNIEKNLKENYDNVFSEIVNAYGAIMLLQENRIDTRTYKEQLRQCAARLLEIVKANHLHVTGIESKVKNKLGFEHDIDLLGYIDMRLSDDNGRPYIFDFKWSGNSKWYSSLLKTNKSLQLSLYKALVNSLEGEKVAAVGYFLMPEGRMVTTSGLIGDLVIPVQVDENRKDKDLIAEMRNSYAYRRNQIEHGLIELGEGEGIDALQYGKDQDEKHLVPLDTDDDGKKASNKFSSFDMFKRK